MRFEPHPYQEYAINRIVDQPYAGLFLDMGLGKTVITLTAVDRLMYEDFAVNRVLVIAPKRVAEDTWTSECGKWDHLSHITVSKVLGTPKQREAALKTDADIYVINRENTEWLVTWYWSQRQWPFDMVVVDELSSFKSHQSKRFKALRKVRPLVSRFVGLTGTPAPNGLIDLWPQMYLIDMGERLGRSITAYRDRFFIPEKVNGFIVYSYALKKGAEEKIRQLISDICVSMKAEDYLTMPDLIVNDVKVRMDKAEFKKYKTLEKERLLEVDPGQITATSAGVLSGKLSQMANGCIIYKDASGGGGLEIIHDRKLDALADIIEASAGQSVLVFYWFRHDLSRLRERFASLNPGTINGSDDIRAWNEGRLPLVFAQPGSMGHGLNLQAGGHIIVWFGLTWSLELYEQANARLYRQGQQHGVIIHRIITEDTVDEDVVRALARKDRTQDGLMQALKARIEAVTKKPKKKSKRKKEENGETNTTADGGEATAVPGTDAAGDCRPEG